MSAGRRAAGGEIGTGYRPALDGVRALAVIGVIAYHVSYHATGGFLGVDVFFVLSGYLITGLLLDGFATRGLRSLAEFWIRRARRLLPALLILVAVVAIVVGAGTGIKALPARRGDILSTLFYYANWHFISVDESYFASMMTPSPLRHAWSLAIEEQFYLVWPVLLLVLVAIVSRARERRDGLLLGVLVILAALSELDMALRYKAVDPSPAYYATDARVQQLLIGAALTVLMRRWRRAPPHRISSSSAHGWPLLVAVMAGLVIVTHAHDAFYYRGGATVFALGTALLLVVIELHPQSWPARILSRRPVVWVGTISYGLYLWHWPLVVWLTPQSVAINYHVKEVLEVGGAFVAATLSFYLVERPIRSGRVPGIRLSRSRFAVVTVAVVAAVTVLGLQETEIGGPAKLVRQLKLTSDDPCPTPSPTTAGFIWCVRVRGPAGAPVVATAGDSTARALDPGLLTFARTRGWTYVQAAQNGCSFMRLLLPGLGPNAIAQTRNCEAGIPRLIAAVQAREHPRLWIYSDRWAEEPVLLGNGEYVELGDPRRVKLLAAAFTRTLHILTENGARVVVVAEPPAGAPVECALHHLKHGCDEPGESTAEPITRETDEMYRQVSATMPGRVFFVSVTDIVCPGPGGHCPAAINGTIVRYDQIHYSAAFSRKLMPIILSRAQREGLQLG